MTTVFKVSLSHIQNHIANVVALAACRSNGSKMHKLTLDQLQVSFDNLCNQEGKGHLMSCLITKGNTLVITMKQAKVPASWEPILCIEQVETFEEQINLGEQADLKKKISHLFSEVSDYTINTWWRNLPLFQTLYMVTRYKLTVPIKQEEIRNAYLAEHKSKTT